ncbi:MAG TPA: TetR/AcrR family transcriptional regulator [Chitinophagaceae bacterium]
MDIRERIQVKAQELFMQYGIRSVSMDDIATQLGMSKKTIYQYFSDKDELVDAVLDGEIHEMQGNCKDCSAHAVDAIHEMFLTLDHVEEQLRHINPIVLYDLEKFHFKTFQKFQLHKQKFLYDIIKHNIEWGMQEELYRPDLQVDTMAKFRLESIMIPFNITVFPPSRYNVADVTREIIEHFVYGLATPKGYKLIQKYKHERIQKQPSNAKTK